MSTNQSESALHQEQFVATDTDECSRKKQACGDVAVCKNTVGSFQCICPKGFSFDDEESKCYGKYDTSPYKTVEIKFHKLLQL